MKKVLSIIAALLAAATLFAQDNAKKEIKAYSGETTVTLQGSYTPSFAVDGIDKKVNNVILLIGDGMGLGAVNAAMYANGGELTMTNLRHFGFVRTQSANKFTTDSAASGSAYATGVKTNNGFLGMDPDKKAVANIPEKVADAGIACGVVSTDNMSGATPAAFFAHQDSRSKSEAIWADLASSKLCFASAGSMPVFEGIRKETQKAIKENYKVVGSLKDFSSADEKVVYLPQSVQYAERGDYLPVTTEAAIEFLAAKKGKGFFLMVEGARIDKESHSNNCEGTVRETLDFDKAIEAAIRFAEKDGHTLVIISADHETGAVAMRDAKPAEGFVEVSYSTGSHSPIAVPLFAFGPHSADFCCYQENSDVSNKIVSLLLSRK